jgi:hypothetical protein
MTTRQSVATWLVVCGLSGTATYRAAQKLRDFAGFQRLMALLPAAPQSAPAIPVPPALPVPLLPAPPPPLAAVPPASQPPILTSVASLPLSAGPKRQSLPVITALAQDPVSPRGEDAAPAHPEQHRRSRTTYTDSVEAIRLRADAMSERAYWTKLDPPGGLKLEIIESLNRIDGYVAALPSADDQKSSIDAAREELNSLRRRRGKE